MSEEAMYECEIKKKSKRDGKTETWEWTRYQCGKPSTLTDRVKRQKQDASTAMAA
jgi:hypothetical protein